MPPAGAVRRAVVSRATGRGHTHGARTPSSANSWPRSASPSWTSGPAGTARRRCRPSSPRTYGRTRGRRRRRRARPKQMGRAKMGRARREKKWRTPLWHQGSRFTQRRRRELGLGSRGESEECELHCFVGTSVIWQRWGSFFWESCECASVSTCAKPLFFGANSIAPSCTPIALEHSARATSSRQRCVEHLFGSAEPTALRAIHP